MSTGGQSEDGETLATVTGSGPLRERRSDRLGAGACVGRYIVVEHLASGGMGDVYRAFDPGLSREVAVKLLRDGLGDSEERDRLLREAQALAQVSHPNVAAVFDVGVDEGRVFLAMELIRGENVRDWLREARTPAEIVRVFAAAGRGLSAAHEAGLVHRDFKPHNVLVGEDGRVRVVDFGLARVADEHSGTMLSAEEISDRFELLDSRDDALSTSSRDVLHGRLTRDGMRPGTPRYMSPEQLMGTELTAQSDQFSFAVSLYEALYKERPFRARDFNGLREQVILGKPDAPPSGATVDKRLHRILMRGMARLPQERFSSMADLVAELERDPWSQWRRFGFAAGAAAAAAFAVFLGSGTTEVAASPCDSSAQYLAGVWDDPTRAELEASFRASKSGAADATWQQMSSVLDDFAASWQRERDQSCQATLVTGEQTQQTYERRGLCLERHLRQVEAFVGMFRGDIDPALFSRAPIAVRELTNLSDCTGERLLATAPLPASPDVRTRVEELATRLDRLDVLDKVGQHRTALEQLDDVRSAASDLEFPPLHARIGLLRADLTQKIGQAKNAEPLMYEALSLAAKARDPRIGARAWRELLWTVGYRLGRPKDAMAMLPGAELALSMVDDDPVLQARFRSCVGILRYLLGDYPGALGDMEQAVAILEPLGEAPLNHLANEVNNLGIALAANDRPDEALAAYARSLAINEKLFGASHPHLATPLVNLAGARALRGERAEAIPMYRRAIALLESEHGNAAHPDLAAATSNLADVLMAQRDYGEAATLFRRALAMQTELVGGDNVNTAWSMIGLGTALMRQGNLDEAAAHLEKARGIREESLGPDHENVAGVLQRLGELEQRRGRWPAARDLFARARDIFATARGETDRRVAASDVELAACDLALGKRASALKLATSAHEVLATLTDNASSKELESLAKAKFLLARIQVETGTSASTSAALAAEARELYRRAGDLADARSTGQWLDSLPPELRQR